LKWIHEYAAGATGLLGDNDNYTMKVEVDNLIFLLSNLRDSKEKNRGTTKDCVALAQKVLKIWR